MPPLPRFPVGTPINAAASPQARVELFLDLCCPFSKKMFAVVLDQLCPALEAEKPGQVQFVVQNVPQPWHPQSAYMHEASFAAKHVAPESFGAYCKAVFDNLDSFVDGPTMHKSRVQIYDDLADIAGSVGIDRAAFLAELAIDGSGNKTTQEMKFAVKYHRARGVHVTPTVHLNGLEAPQISSSATLDDWKAFLAEALQWNEGESKSAK